MNSIAHSPDNSPPRRRQFQIHNCKFRIGARTHRERCSPRQHRRAAPSSGSSHGRVRSKPLGPSCTSLTCLPEHRHGQVATSQNEGRGNPSFLIPIFSGATLRHPRIPLVLTDASYYSGAQWHIKGTGPPVGRPRERQETLELRGQLFREPLT